jgi:hypothetical protein
MIASQKGLGHSANLEPTDTVKTPQTSTKIFSLVKQEVTMVQDRPL